MSDTILVTGAAGQLGRAIVNHLLDAEKVEPSRIIATSRAPTRLSDLAALGVSVRHADFDDPSTLEPAFEGADKLLIVSTDTLELGSGRRLRQHEAALAAGKRAGASHIAYTSEAGADGSPFLLTPDHLGTEKAIKESGLRYTIFRANSYQEMLLLALPGVVGSGKWHTSAGEGRVAYAARDDMASAIAAHLAIPFQGSSTLTVTGPVAYSNAEVARHVTEVTLQPIELVSVSDSELAEILQRFGMPEPFARTLASADAHTRLGHAAETSDILERLSRRKPKSLRAFLEASKAALLPPPR